MITKYKSESFGFLYLAAKYLPEGMVDDNIQPEQLENLEQQLAEEEGVYSGTLRLNIKHLQDLYTPADLGKLKVKLQGSAPACIKGSLKKSTYQLYNQTLDMPVTTSRLVPAPLRLEVYSDGFISDTLVAFLNLQLEETYVASNTWGINKVLPLQVDKQVRGENSKYFKSHPEASQFGELYLQAMFVPKGVTPNPVLPDLLVDYSKMMAD